jgi:ribosomal protein S18 acetylase RimI-like enzyme
MIRKATSTDFYFLYSLYMSPAVNPFLLYEIMDKDSFRPVMQELVDKGYLYIFMQDDLPAGMFKLVPMPFRNSHVVYLGGLAIAPSFSGQGLAKIMLAEIITQVKESGFLRIELTVAVINEKAIRLYETAGFCKEGVLTKFTFLASENRYIDEQVMAYLI